MMTDPAAAGQAARPGLRILVVDDNHDAADSLAWLAGLWGYEARTAYSGSDVLETARRFRPDCLVLDIGLPGLDGYALARQIRQDAFLSRAKLIALSAYGGETWEQQLREVGFDHYLTKPADPHAVERLFQMIQQTLKLAQKTEALAQENVQLAKETKNLLSEVKEEIKEVKEELKEVKEEIREVKNGGG
jgi:two-component system OmpR family response regulator